MRTVKDKRMTNTITNYIYNVLYQLLAFILPLVTAPYIARVLGPEKIGCYSYSQACAYYFVILSMLGVNNYGNRSVAKVRNNQEELRTTFWNIYAIQFVLCLFAILCYIALCFGQSKRYGGVLYTQIFYVMTGLLDINWLFFGLEKFKITVIRNMLIKLLTVFCVFIFVKCEEDLCIYGLILAVSSALSCLYLWIYIPKLVPFCKPRLEIVRSHLKPDFLLFIPLIAVSLYKYMDKIMLGLMSSVTQVGYYENAAKIINIPSALITALGTVMLPKISNLIATKDIAVCKKYIYNSMIFVNFSSVACFFGLISVSKEITVLLFGEKFLPSVHLIELLAVSIIFVSWANVIRTQYLIPNGIDKSYLHTVCLGAIVNIIANAMLIPYMGATGAVIGTVFTEAIVCVAQTIAVRKELPIREYFKLLLFFGVDGLIMYTALISLNQVLCFNYIFNLLIKVCVGAFCYMAVAFWGMKKKIVRIR